MKISGSELPDDLVENVKNIAVAAGREIMAVYDREFSVESKQDGSPLTQADRRSHDCIVAGLRSIAMALPVLSEESTGNEFQARRDWESFWLVDPLDGTREFVKRNGEFTVNIALICEHFPVFGVVHAPVLKSTWWGVAGRGAMFESAEKPAARIQTSRVDVSHIRAVASRSHLSVEVSQFLHNIASEFSVPDTLNMGSSLKLCLVADGTADVYPRLGPTSEWDTAAAHAVVNAAGGSVTDLAGEPLVYNKQNILNPWFIVAGDNSVNWPLFAAGLNETNPPA